LGQHSNPRNREVITAETGTPPLIVRRQPEGIALGAMNNEGNLLCAHGGEV
jgi:hypothetical protein